MRDSGDPDGTRIRQSVLAATCVFLNWQLNQSVTAGEVWRSIA
jgi:hypothetical protein